MAIIEGELDPINVLKIVPPLFLSIALAFFGFQTNNLGQLVAGLVFFVLISSGLILTGGRIFNSEVDPYYAALGYVLGILAFAGPSLLGNLNFSLLATPSDSYLAAALGTGGTVTTIMNNFLAPAAENLALLALAIILLRTSRTVTDNRLIQAAITIIPTSLTFALLHGVRTPFFFLLAGGFMAIWIVMFLGDEFGFPSAMKYGIGGFALTVGLHRGNNVNASGGLIEYYQTLLGAEGSLFFIGAAIFLVDMIIYSFVLYKTGEILLTNEKFQFG